jgi:prenyl protein peptidase
MNPWLTSILVTLCYVGVLYIHPKGRPSADRDSTQNGVIKVRFIEIGCITVLLLLITASLLDQNNVPETVRVMFLLPKFDSICYSLLLTMVLFIGPLVERVYIERSIPTPTLIADTFTTWQGQRAYIMVQYAVMSNIKGPLTEELVFRACILPVLLHGGVTTTKAIFLSPLLFGLGKD